MLPSTRSSADAGPTAGPAQPELPALGATELAPRTRDGRSIGSLGPAALSAYLALREAFPPSLRAQCSRRGGPITALCTMLGRLAGRVSGLERRRLRLLSGLSIPWWTLRRSGGCPQPGPAAHTLTIVGGLIPRNAGGGWTLGNAILLRSAAHGSDPETLNHEYMHVLQYRRDGLRFLLRYAYYFLRPIGRRNPYYGGNPYETEAQAISDRYRTHPWLPDVWDLP